MAAVGPPPNPNGYPRKSAWLVEQQLHTQDQFDYYRTFGAGRQGWSPRRRARRIGRRAQPVRAAAAAAVTPGFLDPGAREDRRAMGRLAYRAQANREAFVPAAPGPLSPGSQDFSAASLNSHEVRRLLALAGLRFVKVLGWGGNGLATLWVLRETTWDPATQSLTRQFHNVVLKNHFGLDQSEDQMDSEKRFMRTMARAPHVQQRLSLSAIVNKPNAFPPPAAGGVPPPVLAPGRLDDDPRFLWMRFARYKELDSWIRRVHAAGSSFPRPVLWRIFKCLVDACVAMACPPRYRGPMPAAAVPVQGPDLPEALPPGVISTAPGYLNLVHFDLDPQNIFLLDTDAGEHQDVPRLQVADFGYTMQASDFGAPAYDDYEKVWSSRDSGKVGYYFPEQFTREWDNVNYEPYSEGFTTLPLNRSAGAAAAYSEKSNLYSVALTMRCCMTLCCPDTPPLATYVDHGGWAAWSYGADVEGPAARARFGDMMCDLVVRCLAHRPLQRPGLSLVRGAVARAAADDPLAPADARWVADTVLGPGGGAAPAADAPAPAAAGYGAELGADVLGF